MTREEFLGSLIAEVFSWNIVTIFDVVVEDHNEIRIMTWDHIHPKFSMIVRVSDLEPIFFIYMSSGFQTMKQYWMDIKKQQESNRQRIFGDRNASN